MPAFVAHHGRKDSPHKQLPMRGAKKQCSKNRTGMYSINELFDIDLEGALENCDLLGDSGAHFRLQARWAVSWTGVRGCRPSMSTGAQLSSENTQCSAGFIRSFEVTRGLISRTQSSEESFKEP